MGATARNAILRDQHAPTAESEGGARTDGQLLERFLARREEEAFTALVRRHGAMVLGVCRRVLRDRHDAEDAFQATFLVLARKAASVHPRQAVGAWLYGVAYRTAKKAGVMSARRRVREQQFRKSISPSTQTDSRDDILPLLDEELSRLPAKYQSAIVLCDLEGISRKDVAARLQCPEGTLSSWLARGRKLLARRLAQRGVALSAGTLAVVLAREGRAAVPSELVAATGRVATVGAAGRAAAVPASVADLADGVVKALLLVRLRAVVAIALLAACAAGGIGVLARSVDTAGPPRPPRAAAFQPNAAKPRRSPQAAPVQKPAAERGRVEGRITAADTGRPVPGATVRVLVQGVPGQSEARSVSDADGRYVVDLPLGHANFWGLFCPPGFYTQDSRTFGPLVTTAAAPRVVRDFTLQPGASWRVELHGIETPLAKPPYFSAMPNPGRQIRPTGEGILQTGDLAGKAVLTIPTGGGKFGFAGGLLEPYRRYEFPPATLDVDAGFDPRDVRGKPEPVPGRPAVQLRDGAGRTAVVEGVEVAVDGGQAVIRFPGKKRPADAALTLRGTAVDEAGKAISGAEITAALARNRGADGSSAAMSNFRATTGSDGRFEVRDVSLSTDPANQPSSISVVVVKGGYDGVQTPEFAIGRVPASGVVDFGTLVLKPGRVLLGQVVDENGRPLPGAVVTNLTNYFLYSHLRCRTDVNGRFAMPDLSFGPQKLEAQFGDRAGQVEFTFSAANGECLVTARPPRKQ